MRESTMWATNGGPIIGEIRNGKKYPFGTVSADQYEADMAALNTEISGLNSAVIACQGSLTGLQTALDTLAGQYAATVPGLTSSVADIRVQISDVSAALTAATQSLTASIAEVGTRVDNLDSSYAPRFTALGDRIDALSSRETQDVDALSGRIDTVVSDLRSTSITVRDHTTGITALNTSVNRLNTEVENLKPAVQSNTSAIEAQAATIGSLSSDLGAVTDLATGTAATTAANSEAITGIRDAITAMRASITANAEAISAFNSAITELTATQSADRATLTARIQAVENSVSALAQTVEGYNTTLTNQIAGLRADMTVNSQDIAVIKSTLQTQGAAIASAEDRCTAVETRMNAQEVGMATLRQQLLNSVNTIENEIEQIVTDKAAIKASVAALAESISAYEADTAITLRELNARVAALEDSIPLEILNFKASPDICEIGGSENVILSWNIQGTIAQITLDGQDVTGTTEITKPNVHEPTTYLLNVVDRRGNTARATVAVEFVNHIFWGTSANAIANEATLKSLDFTELSDVRTRTIRVEPDLEFIYYGYPKRLGTSEFKVNDFVGGFEDPVIVSVDNHAGYSEDYYVYRSANRLDSTFDVHVI